MPTESGDQKLLGNYRRLIDLVSADTSYNPANPDITKTALAAHYTESLAARGVRDGMLYLNEDSVANRALLVKAYVHRPHVLGRLVL